MKQYVYIHDNTGAYFISDDAIFHLSKKEYSYVGEMQVMMDELTYLRNTSKPA